MSYLCNNDYLSIIRKRDCPTNTSKADWILKAIRAGISQVSLASKAKTNMKNQLA